MKSKAYKYGTENTGSQTQDRDNFSVFHVFVETGSVPQYQKAFIHNPVLANSKSLLICL